MQKLQPYILKILGGDGVTKIPQFTVFYEQKEVMVGIHYNFLITIRRT